ncbi:hypothetical protein P3S67_012452 [Capsicum chacoense]
MDLTYIMCWRAKEQALQDLRGKPSASYKKLPAYIHSLNTTYPGSHIRMKKHEDNEFLYIFVALTTFIQGFDHCRPVIVVDASYLRGLYSDTFVAVCTMDGAGHIFSLTYGIVDSENDASWTWFFQNLKEVYGEREHMCVVFDRNPSIIKAVVGVYNNVLHYTCRWHLWGNVKKKLESHMMHCLKSSIPWRNHTQSEFHNLMEKVEVVDVRVKNYLELAGYDKWVIPASEYVYTVHDKEKHFIVCLKEKKCSCHAFQLDEIPCVHACAVLDSKNLEKGRYCSNLYKSKIVLKTYDLLLYPLPHKDDWVIPQKILDEVVLPPKYKRPPKRPAKKERGKLGRDMFGKKSKNYYSSCGQKGHNRRSCRKYNI